MYHNFQGAVEAEFRRSANGSSSLVLKGSDVTVIFLLFLYIPSSSSHDLVWTHKWPFQGLSDLHLGLGDQKVSLKKLGTLCLFILGFLNKVTYCSIW